MSRRYKSCLSDYVASYRKARTNGASNAAERVSALECNWLLNTLRELEAFDRSEQLQLRDVESIPGIGDCTIAATNFNPETSSTISPKYAIDDGFLSDAEVDNFNQAEEEVDEVLRSYGEQDLRRLQCNDESDGEPDDQ